MLPVLACWQDFLKYENCKQKLLEWEYLVTLTTYNHLLLVTYEWLESPLC